MRREQGQALLTVLTGMMLLQAVAWAFLYQVHVEQRLAGGSARHLSALYLAEAGLRSTLQALEEGTLPAGWVLPHQEPLGQGTFTVEAVDPGPSGLITIVVRGELAGAHRRLKALALAGPHALTFGLFAQNSVSLGGQGRTYLLSTRVGESRRRRVGDLAARDEVRFENADARLNAFEEVPLPLREGIIADRTLLRRWNVADSDGLVNLVLGDKGRLFSGRVQRYVDFESLRRDIRGLGIRRVKLHHALHRPVIDEQSYRDLAASNVANAAINAAVAGWGIETGFETKRHSLYTRREFELVRAYLMDNPEVVLRGPIYVEGPVDLFGHERLTIVDGVLGVSGDIVLRSGARVEVRHGPGARVLPGMVTWEEGSIEIEQRAAAIVDGLVLVDDQIRVSAGTVDVIGAIASARFHNKDGIVVVRYDPVVLATVGLKRTGKGFAELVSWQELP